MQRNLRIGPFRVFLALILAGAATAIALTIIVAVSWINVSLRPRWNGPWDFTEDLFWALLIYWVFGVLATSVLGLPTWALYRRLGWQSRTAFTLGGLILGIITEFLLTLWLASETFARMGHAEFWINQLMLSCALGGIAAAVVFRWTVSRPR
jgi:hypothetical protein